MKLCPPLPHAGRPVVYVCVGVLLFSLRDGRKLLHRSAAALAHAHYQIIGASNVPYWGKKVPFLGSKIPYITALSPTGFLRIPCKFSCILFL